MARKRTNVKGGVIPHNPLSTDSRRSGLRGSSMPASPELPRYRNTPGEGRMRLPQSANHGRASRWC